jgi:hypothetical protein
MQASGVKTSRHSQCTWALLHAPWVTRLDTLNVSTCGALQDRQGEPTAELTRVLQVVCYNHDCALEVQEALTSPAAKCCLEYGAHPAVTCKHGACYGVRGTVAVCRHGYARHRVTDTQA